MVEEKEIALFALQRGVATPEQQEICCEYIHSLQPILKPKRPSKDKGDLIKEFEMALMVERYFNEGFQDEVFELEPELRRDNFRSDNEYKKEVVYPAVARVYKVQASTVRKADTNWKSHLKEHESSDLSLNTKTSAFLGLRPRNNADNGCSKVHFERKYQQKWESFYKSVYEDQKRMEKLSPEQRLEFSRRIISSIKSD